MRILIVEDDQTLAEAISRRLCKQGHAADVAADGGRADSILRHQAFDLIILDLNLPGLGGEQVLARLRQRNSKTPVLARLRQRNSKTPVLVLTARGQIEDRISLLDLGADDYLTKPFDFGELEARSRALLRRSQGQAQDRLSLGNTELDRHACTVTVGGEPVALKQREFRLLEIFLSHQGRVLSKEELLDHLYSFDETPGANAIELYVARLRKKLTHSSVQIRTLRGLGYVVENAPA
ncbi:response regulator transcription factor [Marinobacterium rhizophilum]|uniref:Response regulator transcription factor n=1 Tax=Marinobacterium rhizophilum TaxID=420402 RepID=A0ABY5HIS7_9GAMM|nr:response regulator transcription factor [Marinobacterium rhizophilum]UTW11508.1 response regulator transcription factor [Marinobacterium rhizophilum]